MGGTECHVYSYSNAILAFTKRIYKWFRGKRTGSFVGFVVSALSKISCNPVTPEGGVSAFLKLRTQGYKARRKNSKKTY